MGLVGKNNEWEYYGGFLWFIDSEGNIVVDNFSEDNYVDFIGELVEKWFYLKFFYYKFLGYFDGIYWVGFFVCFNVCYYIGILEVD